MAAQNEHTFAPPTAAVVVVSPQSPFYSGDEVTLRCDIAEYTDWDQYFWYRNESHVPKINDIITIRLPEEAGQYQCSGWRKDHPQTSYISSPTDIKHHASPKATVVMSPKPPLYSEERVTLRCNIDNNTDWGRYNWYKNNSPVRRESSKTITITLPQAVGSYQCSAERRDRPQASFMSSPTDITLHDPPTATVVVVSPLSPFYSGERVTLRCNITECTDWDQYYWFRDSSPVPKISKIITITLPQEAGQYWCYGQRKDRPKTSSTSPSTKIANHAPPTAAVVVVSPQSPFYSGDEVTLRCDIAEYTDWSQYYWYRNTSLVSSQKSATITITLPQEAGQYECSGQRKDRPQASSLSEHRHIWYKDISKAVVTLMSNWSDVFSGETLHLQCNIQEEHQHKHWQYSWYKNGDNLVGVSSGPDYTVMHANESHSGIYCCRGTRRGDSETSEAVRVTLLEKPTPVLRGPPQTWLTEGDSVTLSCEVGGSTTAWRFHWYKTALYRPELPQVTQSGRYYVELVSDSIRGAGGSYTLSPAALRHTGVYVCRAERGEPAYHTEFSNPQPLWVTGLSPPSSLVVYPNTNQHFTFESLSLNCEGSGNSTGRTLRGFSRRIDHTKCPSCWTEVSVYWCQSDSGEQSNPVNITVYGGDVILESPAHPVTDGDPLTLHCRYRNQSSNISADFYKDGTLLQTSTTGEMTIPAVSKSHEGLYKCSNPERGESPESWITVKAPDSGSSLLVTVGTFVRLVIMFVLIIMLLLLYRFKKLKVVNNRDVQNMGQIRRTVRLQELIMGLRQNICLCKEVMEKNMRKWLLYIQEQKHEFLKQMQELDMSKCLCTL
ncbi:Fc receptor-like protein 5 [Alosa pseudoharengus]|uniref:Fc receptor-like protein 5 n=1 Tax=Alosa pseudoharengus TaxID=34774 RepID=UPI003F8A7995